MKFDLVFSNPPYNANTDIKILNEVIDCADEWVVVHPSTWVLDLKKKTKSFNKFISKIDRKVHSVEFFNGNPIFNIGLFVPCMITHFKSNIDSVCEVNWFGDIYEASNLNNITKFGSSWKNLISPFVEKIQNEILSHSDVWNKRINSNDKNIDNSKYYCQLAAIRGHVNLTSKNKYIVQDDFYTMIMKDSNQNKGIRNLNVRKDGFIVYEFDTSDQLDNFINYLKSDFARFCLAILKNTQNIHYGEMELIPWLDFNEVWDDEKLFEKFDVSDELQTYIREFLPDYYGIRK